MLISGKYFVIVNDKVHYYVWQNTLFEIKICFFIQMCIDINGDNIQYVYKSKKYAVKEMYAVITK